MVQVIDDFLPSYEFKKIQNILTGEEIPWRYNSQVVSTNFDNYQYVHTFFDQRYPWNGISSTYYPIFSFCLQSLQVEKLYRIKSNSNPKTFFRRNSDLFNLFKNGTFVRSVENRMVIFDSNQEHESYLFDKNVRVVVNFNYEKYGKN